MLSPDALTNGKAAHTAGAWWEGDRPSAHGAALGSALADLVDRGSPEGAAMCATCAFRKGTAPNQTAGTVLTALHCVLGTNPDPFGCHHGMIHGQPTRLCAGYEAARRAPFAAVRGALGAVKEALAEREGQSDQVRADFDAWASQIDPGGKLDVYQIARARLAEGRSLPPPSPPSRKPTGWTEA